MAAEQPKKPAGGAFGQYMKVNRPALLKECAGKPAVASVKLGSERYKGLDASSAAKYQKMYEQAKAQYAKDLAAFTAAGGEMKARKGKREGKQGKQAKGEKDPNKPKKPVGGAYGSFMAKNRPELAKECAGKPPTAVTRLAAERWKALSDAARVPFEKAYKAKQEAYNKAMKTYVPPAAAADEEDDGDEEGADDDEDAESIEEDKPVPKKRKIDAKDSAASPKKGKTMEDPAAVMAEAKALGFASKLKALSDNPSIKHSPAEILAKLQEHNGSVIAAKRAMLG